MKERENFERPQDYVPAPVRLFSSCEEEALIMTAEAYRARERFLQYDDTRMVLPDDEHVTKEYRFGIGERAPEYSTSENYGYTNCAGFTYDCYLQAFGQDILAWTTDRLIASEDMLVYRYYSTGKETQKQKKAIQKEYTEKLLPGDIIVMRYNGNKAGHAMLYVGDGKIIHSTAPKGGNFDYEKKIEKMEPTGSVCNLELAVLFDESNPRYFFKAYAYGIVRPSLKYDLKITAQTKNRVKYLRNVYAEKVSTCRGRRTVEPGEEITFTFRAINYNDNEVVLKIEDTIPQNTEYVSGCTVKGNKLKAELKVPAGKTKEISYTVKVNDGALIGTKIDCQKAKICGVTHPCNDIYVMEKPSFKDKATAKKYTGKKAQEMMEKLFKTHPRQKDYQTLTKDISELVPCMYGGRMVASTKAFGGRMIPAAKAYGPERTRGITLKQLVPGDLILYGDKTETFTLFMTAKGLCDMNSGELLDEKTAQEKLYSLLAYYRFAVVRPR